MKFHTDHHFIIGHGHLADGKPCQDYTLSGLVGGGAYAVVSDGCSSAGQTDIGSRIIAITTGNAIIEAIEQTSRIIDESISLYVSQFSRMFAEHARRALGLTNWDMMATQLYAVVDNTGHASLSVYGDGAMVLVSRTGIITAYVYEWARNAPFYPFQDRKIFTECQGGSNTRSLLETFYQIDAAGEALVAVEHPFSTEDGCNGIKLLIDVEKTDTALICLFTDGIQQVDNMSLFDTLRGLVGFKTLSGEFVKRRLIRFLNDSKKAGLGPIDDLGVAVIAIDREEE